MPQVPRRADRSVSGRPAVGTPESGGATIGAHSIRQTYGRRVVLDHFDFQAGPGVFGLLGPNGAGKTTLIKTLATVVPPARGALAVGGVEVGDGTSLRHARRSIGYLPQDFGYPPRFTVLEYVRYCSWLRGVTAPSRSDCMDAIAMTGLERRATSKMKTLSGGMLQRAGIAGAVVGRPPIILLDEPTVGLDPAQRLQFRSLLAELSSSAVVLATHLIEDVAAACDRVAVMNEGAMLFDGPTADLASRGTGTEVPGSSELERGYLAVLANPDRRSVS